MVRQLLTGSGPAHHDERHLSRLHGTIVLALVALWLTGIAIVWLDMSAIGWAHPLLIHGGFSAMLALVAFSACQTWREQWGWISAGAKGSLVDPLGAAQTQGG